VGGESIEPRRRRRRQQQAGLVAAVVRDLQRLFFNPVPLVWDCRAPLSGSLMGAAPSWLGSSPAPPAREVIGDLVATLP